MEASIATYAIDDQNLIKLIEKCRVETLKVLLAKVNVPCHGVTKCTLQKRLFYAVRTGLELAPTADEEDASRVETRKRKLQLENVSLPHPLTLNDWEKTPANFPPLTDERTTQYFDRSKCQVRNITYAICFFPMSPAQRK